MGIASGSFAVLRKMSRPKRSVGFWRADVWTYMSKREGISAYGFARWTMRTGEISSSENRSLEGFIVRGDRSMPFLSVVVAELPRLEALGKPGEEPVSRPEGTPFMAL